MALEKPDPPDDVKVALDKQRARRAKLNADWTGAREKLFQGNADQRDAETVEREKEVERLEAERATSDKKLEDKGIL